MTTVITIAVGIIVAAVAWVAYRTRRGLMDRYPEGCCTCGTGGPYYEGSKTPVTRYLYAGACPGSDEFDWSSCSEHPIGCGTLLVDYGEDRVVSIWRARKDAAEALRGAA